MPLDSQLTIRPMKRQEMDLALEWAKNEGWNPGRNDANSFYNADPSGHFMGFLSGVPVGCISAVAYGKAFGFLGLYIVRPEYRGKGYGIQLWKHALKHLGARNIGLDGVVARQQDYQKYGFKLAYRNLRYGGDVVGDNGMAISKNIAELASFNIDDIVKYDSKMFPAPRQKFLAEWVRQKGATALGYVSQNANRLSGYGAIRPCVTRHKIGPLFADNQEIAEQLFYALTKNVADGNPVFIDIPEENENALRLAKKMRMKQVFETARMYNLENPNLPIGRIYGVTTLELG